MAYLGFISLGLPDTLIGVAWPSVRDTFQLEQGAMAIVFLGSGTTYFLTSFFTGRLMKMMGIGVLLAASSALVSLAGFGFSLAPLWIVFAIFPLLHGIGSGAIDAGLNHYAAHHFSARQMNWLHACYSLGATFGPLIMTAVITWHGSWRAGYLVVAVILLVLSMLFAATRRRWDDGEEAPTAADEERPKEPPAGAWRALAHPLLWRQAVIFFFYTGLEVAVGQWSYTVLTEARGVDKATAGLWVTIYWGSIAAGRVLFGLVVDRMGIERLLRGAMLASLAGAVLFAANLSPAASALALGAIGLGLAPIYPCLMTQTPGRVGKALSGHAVGFQVSAAMIGAAALPSVCGLLAQNVGLGTVPFAAVAMALVLLVLHEDVVRRARGAF